MVGGVGCGAFFENQTYWKIMRVLETGLEELRNRNKMQQNLQCRRNVQDPACPGKDPNNVQVCNLDRTLFVWSIILVLSYRKRRFVFTAKTSSSGASATV